MINTELKYNTLNEATFDICNRLLTIGDRIESRNGMTYEMCDQEIFLLKPQNRHLYLEGRKSNIYACLGEIFWIMAGENNLNPLMTFLLPRSPQFSDDGETWQNGYGPKIYNNGNLENVVKSFLMDGKNTRRACMAIWTPQTDTIKSLAAGGIEKPKDVSCNNFIWFWIRDNKLNMKVGVRSNDVLWGLSAINIPEWTFIQEIVLNILKNEDNETFKDVQLGYYKHSVISLHVYDETVKQAQELLDSKLVNAKRVVEFPNYNIRIGKVGLVDIQRLFIDIYNSFCDQISGDVHVTSIDTVFSEWKISKTENQLYHYAKLVESFILNKLGKPSKNDWLSGLSPDLKLAVTHNKFTPKNWL